MGWTNTATRGFLGIGIGDGLTMLPTGVGFIVPDWAMIWFLIFAGAAFILGARRVAILVASVPLIRWFVWPVVADTFPELPLWIQILAIVLVPLLLIHGLITLVFGAPTAAHFTGAWLVRLGDLLLFSPTRGIRGLIGRLFGGG